MSEILLTDEQIEAIDIQCGMDEIGHMTTSTPKGYDYEHRLLKAQLLKACEWMEPRIEWPYVEGSAPKCLFCRGLKQNGHNEGCVFVLFKAYIPSSPRTGPHYLTDDRWV